MFGRLQFVVLNFKCSCKFVKLILVIKTDMQDSGKPEPSISQSHRAGTDESFSWKNRSKYVALGAVIGIMVFLLKPWDLINVNFASSEDNKGQEKVSTMKSEATINK